MGIYMKGFCIIVHIVTLCPMLVIAQAPDTLWTRTYGGNQDERAYSVQQTMDGGYIIAGYSATYGPGITSVYLIKTDPVGDTLWTRTFGGANFDIGHAVRQTTDGGYIITGETNSYGAGEYDIYMIKTDSFGDTLWSRTFGGSANEFGGYSVQQTTDGGYITAAQTRSYGVGGSDVYLIKTDSLGDTLWTKTYGCVESDGGYSVQQTDDGGYIVAGLTNCLDPWSGDVYLIKTDSYGDTLWTKTFGDSSNAEWAMSVQQTTDKGYIITGTTDGWISQNPDVFLIKTDSLGDTLWMKTYGDSSTRDWGLSVQQTIDGGYIISGNHYWLIKTDFLGDTLWTRWYGGNTYEGHSVQQTDDGGYIIVGYKTIGSNDEIYLVKTAPEQDIEEKCNQHDLQKNIGSTIFSGPLLLHEGKNCRVFDITGRQIHTLNPAPGIYFIGVDGRITQKIIKIK